MPNKFQENRLASAPVNLDIRRSRFDRSHSHKTSFNAGDLVPIFLEEVLPGDTFDVQTNSVVRMQTLITPVMDNMYLDTYYFFVPMRLVWEHTKQFFGENTDSAWIPQVEYTIPQLTAPIEGWNVGTIADYFGIPTGVGDLSVNALWFRAYALICNEWFRSENLTDPLNIPVNDTTQAGSNGSNYITDVVNGGMPFKASKYFDLFTAALPAPQKGPDVTLDFGGLSPVITTSDFVPRDYPTYKLAFVSPYSGKKPLSYLSSPSLYSQEFGLLSSSYPGLYGVNLTSSSSELSPIEKASTDSYSIPGNLWADNTALSGVSINELRLAFQIQKFYEREARSGSRYIEIIKSFFGVQNPDYRLQRPEYLGGKRQPINVNSVTQTSASAEGSTAQGNQAAYSVTHSSHNDFFKSFTEHGFIIGLAVVRYDHSYQQGLAKQFSRKTRFDYYWPIFANLGEQPILNKEIFAQGSSVVDSDGNVVDDQVFGYQEAWYDYRYKLNQITGEMRSSYATSLDVWHLGDDYASLPHLSDAWLREDPANIDRVLAVTSSVSNQFFGDFYFVDRATRAMPVYSIPGLIDHH